MGYPFTLFILLLVSAGVQGLLWASYLFFIPWMDRTAMLWTSVAGIAASCIFLVIYRFFATDMKSWSLSLIFCTLMQFAAIANSGYFLWLILVSMQAN